MDSGAALPEGDRGDIRRIVLVSRIAGVSVALTLGIAAYWVHRAEPVSLSALFTYFTVVVGLGAFLALSTLARVGHAKVLERSLEEVRSLTGQLRQMAEQDPLTGLLNLRTFHALVEQEIDLARLERREVSLIVADLDNFKVLNDSFGHQFGDRVLRETAWEFAAAGPPGSCAARLGGDEFALMLAGHGRESAVGVANGIDLALRRHNVDGRAAGMLGSFGVATFPGDGDSVQALFAAADGRMYSEKHRRKAETLASLAGASRKLFVRVGRAMRPDRSMSQILREITRAAREEFDLTLCAITINPRAQHPRVSVASADDPALERACMETDAEDDLSASALGARLPADAWVIDAQIPDESGDGGALALAGMPMSSFRPDASVVIALADLVHAVVANARARVEGVRAGRERDIHIELAHMLAGGGTLHERLSGVTRKIAEFIGVSMVTIQGIDAGNGAQT